MFAGFPKVSLDWSANRAQPGQQVSLTVGAVRPRSQLAVIVVGTDPELSRGDLDVSVEQVLATSGRKINLSFVVFAKSQNHLLPVSRKATTV